MFRFMSFILAGILVALGCARADQPATHGMLIFGKSAIYASHLPMFHAPHDYQVLLRLKFKAALSSDAVAKFERLRPTSQYFTLVPEPLDLTKITSGFTTLFRSALYEGHFERGGRYLGDVEVKVEQVLYAKKLNPNVTPATLKHVVFGEGGEYFAVHLIQSGPSFDEILKVSAPSVSFLPVVLETPNAPDKSVPVGQTLGGANGVVISVLDAVYSDEADLQWTSAQSKHGLARKICHVWTCVDANGKEYCCPYQNGN